MEGNQSNWQNPYSEDKNNPPEDTPISQEESFSDEEGRGGDVRDGIEMSERRIKNRMMIELLENDPLYKDAFDKMVLSNGQSVLLFQPGVYPGVHSRKDKNEYYFPFWKNDLRHELYGNVFEVDTVCYFLSQDGLIVRNVDKTPGGKVPRLEVPNITNWWKKSVSPLLSKIAEEEDENSVPDILPSINMDLSDERIRTFYFPNGLWTQGIKENLSLFGKLLKDVSEERRRNPDKPEDLLRVMKGDITI